MLGSRLFSAPRAAYIIRIVHTVADSLIRAKWTSEADDAPDRLKADSRNLRPEGSFQGLPVTRNLNERLFFTRAVVQNPSAGDVRLAVSRFAPRQQAEVCLRFDSLPVTAQEPGSAVAASNGVARLLLAIEPLLGYVPAIFRR